MSPFLCEFHILWRKCPQMIVIFIIIKSLSFNSSCCHFLILHCIELLNVSIPPVIYFKYFLMWSLLFQHYSFIIIIFITLPSCVFMYGNWVNVSHFKLNFDLLKTKHWIYHKNWYILRRDSVDEIERRKPNWLKTGKKLNN